MLDEHYDDDLLIIHRHARSTVRREREREKTSMTCFVFVKKILIVTVVLFLPLRLRPLALPNDCLQGLVQFLRSSSH